MELFAEDDLYASICELQDAQGEVAEDHDKQMPVPWGTYSGRKATNDLRLRAYQSHHFYRIKVELRLEAFSRLRQDVRKQDGGQESMFSTNCVDLMMTSSRRQDTDLRTYTKELDSDWSSSHDGFRHKSLEHVIQVGLIW